MVEAYSDLHIWKNLRIRSFSEDIESSELIWHRDRKDRLCVVLYGSNWCYQQDNELPIKLSVGDHFFVPQNTYHRIIKGDSNLVLIIKEFEHEHTDETSQYTHALYDKTDTDLRAI